MNKVVVSRQWNHPQITAFLDVKEVGAQIDLDDFLLAMLDEIGKPTYIMTREQLKAKVMAAKDEILSEMKRATAHV
jgi:putative NADH-flavin reductase